MSGINRTEERDLQMNVFPCALANINADKREERQRAKIGTILELNRERLKLSVKIGKNNQ